MNVMDVGERDKLIQLYGPFLGSYCRGLCKKFGHWVGEADDLANDSWINVFRKPKAKWPRIENQAECKRWLSVITRRTFFSRHRGESRREKREARVARERAKQHEANPHEILERKERIEATQMALEKSCSPLRREVVQLKLAGDTFKEIAEKLNISIPVAKQMWRTAKKEIRAEMARMGWSFP